MSRIYFSSPSGEVALRGSERAYAGVLLADLTFGAFGPTGWQDDPLFQVTRYRWDDYADAGGSARFKEAFQSALTVGDARLFTLPVRAGMPPDARTVVLNTALALGNDPVCLLAHLHGKCEIHAWVDGPNRAWLAGIIGQGQKVGVLRDIHDWEEIAAFLRASSTEPVVTSYSVTDYFPTAYVAGYSDDRDGEGWYDIPKERQWEMAMERLREDEDDCYGLEMRPDRWRFPDACFGDGETAFSILEAAH